MTDTRLPDTWLLNPQLDKLSDGAWRALTRALMFCDQQGTDGELDELYLQHVYPYGTYQGYLKELEQIDWLRKTETGYVIPDWEAKGQSLAAQVELWRANARERQRRSRESKKKAQNATVTSDVGRDLGQDTLGQERSGKANYGETVWPEVAQPAGGSGG